MNDSKEISATKAMSQMAAMKMSRFLQQPQQKKAHSARHNDAFTHCGISLISPNTLHQKYSGSLKVSCFSLIFISSGKWHPLWSSFQENDPYMYIYTHTHKTSAVGCPLTINIWMVALFGYSLTEWRWRRVQTDWAVWRWTPHLRGGRTYWVSAGNVRRWRQCVCPHRGQRAIHLQVRQVDGWRCVRYAINKTVMESKMQRNTHTRTHARTHARTHPRARARTHTHTHMSVRAHTDTFAHV